VPAGAPERQRGVLLILDLEERVQHHWSAAARNPAVSPVLPQWSTLLKAQAAPSLVAGCRTCSGRRCMSGMSASRPGPGSTCAPAAASCYGALLVLLLGVCALARARLYIANSRISGVLVAFLAVSASGAVACCSAVVVVMRAAAGARRGSRRAPLRTCPNMTAMFPQHLQLLPRASRSCMYASSVEHAARSS